MNAIDLKRLLGTKSVQVPPQLAEAYPQLTGERLLGKLTREHTLDPEDMRAALSAGASREQIADALAVCFSFNVIGRLADAFGFSSPTQDAFDAGAKYLIARGYR